MKKSSRKRPFDRIKVQARKRRGRKKRKEKRPIVDASGAPLPAADPAGLASSAKRKKKEEGNEERQTGTMPCRE